MYSSQQGFLSPFFELVSSISRRYMYITSLFYLQENLGRAAHASLPVSFRPDIYNVLWITRSPQLLRRMWGAVVYRSFQKPTILLMAWTLLSPLAGLWGQGLASLQV